MIYYLLCYSMLKVDSGFRHMMAYIDYGLTVSRLYSAPDL